MPDSPDPSAGDNRPGAAPQVEELFVRYARQLTRLAEQHLSRKLAARLDGEDVVQSVFRTFFRRTARGEFRIDSSAQLWRLLVKITVLKARAKGRYHQAALRAAGAEAAGDGWLPEALARGPTPFEAAVLSDEIEALLHGYPETHCRILHLRLENYSVAEIASQLGVSRMTVYRVLELFQQRLQTATTERNPPAT